MILVTGATGRVGYPLLEALADAGAECTAMVRVAAKGADLPGTAKYIVGSFDDPPPAEALTTFDQIFLLSPALEEQAELEIRFTDAVLAAGHRPRIVKVAADGFQDPGCDVRFVRSHREIAAHLDATGLPVTYLAPSIYMETLLAAAERIRREALSSRMLARAGPPTWPPATWPGGRPAAHQPGPRGRQLRADRAGGAERRTAGPADLRRVRPGCRLRRPPGPAGPGAAAGQRPGPVGGGGGAGAVPGSAEGGAATVTDDVPQLTGSRPGRSRDWLDESRAGFLGVPPDLPPDVF